MAALFAVAAAVQYNDPDPARWVLIYGSALVACGMVVARGIVPVTLPSSVGIVALGWALFWATSSGEGLSVYAHMFDGWEMKNSHIEEAREASGLLIVAGWMLVLTIRCVRGVRSSSPSTSVPQAD